mmetsp:Transcript_10478/g.34771  ORF Transcript_10478/g.34771 Transcript_10478/m.34771 type:complete len:235 (+) Transcript_10478:948-1652(+)
MPAVGSKLARPLRDGDALWLRGRPRRGRGHEGPLRPRLVRLPGRLPARPAGSHRRHVRRGHRRGRARQLGPPRYWARRSGGGACRGGPGAAGAVSSRRGRRWRRRCVHPHSNTAAARLVVETAEKVDEGSGGDGTRLGPLLRSGAAAAAFRPADRLGRISRLAHLPLVPRLAHPLRRLLAAHPRCADGAALPDRKLLGEVQPALGAAPVSVLLAGRPADAVRSGHFPHRQGYRS